MRALLWHGQLSQWSYILILTHTHRHARDALKSWCICTQEDRSASGKASIICSQSVTQAMSNKILLLICMITKSASAKIKYLNLYLSKNKVSKSVSVTIATFKQSTRKHSLHWCNMKVFFWNIECFKIITTKLWKKSMLYNRLHWAMYWML